MEKFKIYRISLNDINYIGSTAKPIKNRISRHRNCNTDAHELIIKEGAQYEILKDNIETKESAKMYEQLYINYYRIHQKIINIRNPYDIVTIILKRYYMKRTPLIEYQKKYNFVNREKIKIYQKKYYLEKKKISNYCAICNLNFNRASSHLLTHNHIKKYEMKKILNNKFISELNNIILSYLDLKNKNFNTLIN